ncbi:oligoendopeptidase [Deltaproteobacteria bacterium]|nr:oligoendopeptidase [Deltaproteobacteria bacterium]
MSLAPSLTWDLESILPGGPGGAAFEAEYAALSADLLALAARSEALPAIPEPAPFAGLLLDLERISPRIDTLFSFTGCHAAADSQGEAAIRAEARMSTLGGLAARGWVTPKDRMGTMPQAAFEALLAEPSIAHMRNMLLSDRKQGRLRLSEKEESLLAALAQDGISAWGQLYDVEAGSLKVTLDRGNGPETLSAGQAAQLYWDPKREVRQAAFTAVRAGWTTIAKRCATALTHITGTRQTLNDRRGLDELDEPLVQARIARTTLTAIMEACREARPVMQRYFRAKARAMKLEKLEWHDVFAPLGEDGPGVTYEAAQEVIVRQFGEFAPGMAEFATRALTNRWIEVEDRPGKRAGGFCTDVPARHETRIFMTWCANDKAAGTLAHELGHAFHAEVLFGNPVAQRRLPMTLAETASTFAEALVREATRAQATTPGTRLRILDNSLQDATAFLCNVAARFELERELYVMRRKGPLEVEALSAATDRIFTEWFSGELAGVDDLFWAHKLHFYIPGLAFYNYPYIFGFLFANLVYEAFRPQGAAAEAAYRRLLARTGDDDAETIAKEELGLDLGDVATWRRAMAGVVRDVEAFEGEVEALG